MAKTPSEKMKDYRRRLKEKGSEEFRMTLSKKEVDALMQLAKIFLPNHEEEPGNILKALVCITTSKMLKIIQEKTRLIQEFDANDELLNAYVDNEQKRREPLSAEDFLKLMGQWGFPNDQGSIQL